MRTLIKRSTQVMTLLIILAAVTPFAIGFLVQHKYAEFIQTFSDNPNFNIAIENYHRGWFNSEATLKMTLKPALQTPNKPTSFTITQYIQHGPLVYSMTPDMNMRWQFALAAFDSNINQKGFTAKNHSIVKLTGQIVTLSHDGNIKFSELKQAMPVDIKGFQSSFTISPDMKTVDGQVNIQNISVQSKTTKQEIQGLDGEVALNKNAQGIWLGTHSSND